MAHDTVANGSLADGAMSDLVRLHNWAATPLGRREGWPGPLSSAVKLTLHSKQPFLVAWGPELSCIYNDAFIPICGRKHPNGLGMPLSDLWSEIWEELEPLVTPVLAGKGLFLEDTPFALQGREGVERSWFSFSYTPLHDEDGSVRGFFCVAVETTQKVLAERHLTDEVEKRTRAHDRLWVHSRDLQVIVGADGIFRSINPAWTRLLGHEAQEVIGRSFLDFIWPEDAALTQAGLDTAAGTSDLTNFENRFRSKNGTPHWISWHTSVENDLVYAYGRDITAQRQAQQDLERAQEALRQAQKMEAVGQLTGGIAHDFNNLLAAIGGSLELTRTRITQGRAAEADRYINAAQGAVKRAASLTHRLLAFSRRQTLSPTPTNVNRLIGGMEELIRRTVGPAISIEVVGAGGLWPTLIDPNQLENALLNLCLNARDAMPDGGRLTIETANKWLDDRAALMRDLPPGQYISLAVTDTGTGMTPQVISRAFDPFYTTKPIGQGTGLGLSMIYGFARQSGGQIRVYSEVGKGTTMCLYLPRHSEDPGVEAPIAESAMTQVGDGEVVLVVDDEPTVRMLIAELLGEQGYTAIEAADGPSGMKVLESPARIDLLITDVGLPGGINGRQLADAARILRPQLKVLFITGYAENAAVGNGHLDKGMRIVTKPFEMQALARKIKEMIENP